MNNIPHVVLVDEKDIPIGIMEKIEAHRKGLLHRAFSVMLYRKNKKNMNQIEVLLQQRALDKYHGGGLWANTCCSHPMQDEPVLAAAYRRIQEEIFLNQPEHLASIKLTPMGSFIYRAELDHGLIEHELDHVFVGEYEPDLYQDLYQNLYQGSEIPRFNPDEIAQMEWIPLNFLQQELNQPKPFSRKYAPWLPQVVSKTGLFLQ
jgi:isopentenyl-diphosphate delta-isomerase type 1